MDTQTIELITPVLCAAGALLSMVRPLHMLQQNSYVNRRYYSWMAGGNRVGFFLPGLFPLAAEAMLFFPGTAAKVFALVFAGIWVIFSLLSAVLSFKKAIKPLVITRRVLRMFLTAFILFFIMIVIGRFWWPPMLPVCSTVCALGPFLTPFVNRINRPVEQAVARHFTNDAKKILKNSPEISVIGITGSYGKTTTKAILNHVLSEKYTVTATPESYNTPMGVVRTIREKMLPGTRLFLCEMGARQKGDIAQLCDIVHPVCGVITSVGPQHLETFGTIETVAQTKFELADAVASAGGAVYLNGDDSLIAQRAEKYPNRVLYGTGDNADCKISDITGSREGLSFSVSMRGRIIPLKARLLGRHNVLNIAAACAVAMDYGLSDDEIRYAVSTLRAPAHRLELKPFVSGSLLIDDAYNANPSGCLSAVSALAGFDGMKKIIVTPGLVELGEKEADYNRRFGEAIGAVCDAAYLVGKERSVPIAQGIRDAGVSGTELYVVDSFREAMEKLTPLLDASCVVLFENDLPDNYIK